MSPFPQMRDATGRCIELLNSENDPPRSAKPTTPLAFFTPFDRRARQASSIPATPELFRANSYDSQEGPPISPITPLDEPGYLYTSSPFGLGTRTLPEYAVERRFSYDVLDRRPSYEAKVCAGPAPSSRQGNEEPEKRFPCRFREELGCMKTFTTSGHASRHARIHTNQKSVHCTYDGCDKKFTRADNMKQHLETHFKKQKRATVPRSSPPGSSARRNSAASRRPPSLSATARRPAPSREDLADQQARMAIEAQAYAGVNRLPPYPAPQVPEQPYYGQVLAAASSPTVPPAAITGLDALVSVALQQEEP
ncbi:hypothetical protein F5144DRAFT_191266 [Chaetomium tenue]|uniref:Uncharacterized protein n=1 Tax=Chaetomium tenue TaxID=1854479 RepID=A0ACB7PH89_9PEZI|nr:hypothetical protein F5144DRAFT_191266 [Chaetomium globosum]